MKQYLNVGTSPVRKESQDKVSGGQRYVGDHTFPGMLSAALVTSPHAHAKILSIDCSKATELDGVEAVVTGQDMELNLGLYLGDKPPIAREKVRHYGEPIAAVVAENKKNSRICRFSHPSIL